MCNFFFLHATEPTQIYSYGPTLSLHDALPIWCEQHPDIGAGVEDADPERALAAREPFGDRLDRARIGGAFGEAERGAREDELEHAARAGVQDGGEAPQDDGDRQPAPRPDAVEPAPDEEESADRKSTRLNSSH